MPVNRKYDFIINTPTQEYGFMLSRSTKLRGRAWQRTGMPDTPDKRPRAAETVGVLPPQIDFPELWNDWSGGFGYPYREPRDTSSFYGFYENPNRYHWAENFDTRFPHQLVHAQQMQIIPGHPNVAANVLNLIDVPAPSLGGPVSVGFGGVFISVAGSPTGNSGRLYPTGLTGSVDSFDLLNIESMAAGPGRPAIFGSFIYIAVANGSTNNRFLKTSLNDTAVTPEGAHNPLLQGFTTAGNRLWAYQGDGRRIYANSVAAGADPVTAANWSATLNIANAQSQINDMRSYQDQVFVGLEDGLYAGDLSGTFVNVLSDLAGHSDGDNCRDIAIQDGQVIVQHVSGVYAYNPTTTVVGQVREIGPNLFSNQSPVAGMFKCLEAGGPWLYGAVWNGTYSYLLAGIDDNPPGPYSWHVMQRFPHAGARARRIHIDGIVAPSGGVAGQIPQRMWVATDASIPPQGTAPLYVWPIPVMNGDPLGTLNDFHSKANFVGSARMDLGIANNRAPGTPKLYRSVEIESNNLASPYRYLDVYYTIDQGSREYLGRAIDSPRTTLYFPSSTGSIVTGYGVELSLESFAKGEGIITIVSGGSGIVVTCTTTEDHNLATGMSILVTSTIAGLNGTWIVTRLGATTFSLDGSTGVVLPGGGAPQLTNYTGYGTWTRQSPVYRSIVLRSVFMPNSVDLISAVVDTADTTYDRQGAPMRPGDVQMTDLRYLARLASPVTLIDLAGAVNIVKVLQPVEEQEVFQEGDETPWVAATVKMSVLEFTAS
jgi:hypothetical protein